MLPDKISVYIISGVVMRDPMYLPISVRIECKIHDDTSEQVQSEFTNGILGSSDSAIAVLLRSLHTP